MAKSKPPIFPDDKQEEAVILLAVSAVLLHGRLSYGISGPSTEQLTDNAVDMAQKLIASVKKKLDI